MRRNPRSRFSRRFLLGFVAPFAVALLGLEAPRATAQSLEMPRDGGQTLMLEVLQPSLEGFDSKPFSAAFFLSGRGPVSPRVSVVGELPFVRHKSTYLVFGPADYSSSTIGSPYAGVEFRLGSGPAFLEVGVRPPLVADDEYLATLTGRASDVTRWEAFTPDAFSVLAAFNVRETTVSKIAFRLRACPALVIPTGNNNRDPVLHALYSFRIGYQGSMARFGVGMAGRSQLTTESGFSYDPLIDTSASSNLGERSASQFELHADFLRGRVRPAVDLHVPLGPMGNFVPLVVGVGVSWTR